MMLFKSHFYPSITECWAGKALAQPTKLRRLTIIIGLLFLFASSAQAGDLLKPCRVDGFAQQVQCGQIQRPLNLEEPQGKQIDIHFIVLAAKDKNKAPDPIFFIAGGPGQSAINVASWLKNLFEKLNRRHDLVFVDQRGTGRSAPLSCPEFDTPRR